MTDSISSGRARRFLEVGGLATQVGTSYLWQTVLRPFRSLDENRQQLLETHLDNALRLVEGSARLRGAFTKLVQILSTRGDVLPVEVLDVLSTVQADVPPMSFAAIREQVERELGDVPERLFARFEPDALAAASLGQVHAAELPSGEAVVVKVQYPGVEASMLDDVENLELILDVFGRIASDVMGARLDARSVARELRERLHEELDYVQEAKNVEIFRRLFGDDPDVTIPEVVPGLCSRRVLTMTRLEGYPLGDLFAPTVDPELRSWVAEKMVRLFCRQLFRFGVVHTDPHPGNTLVTFHPRIGLVDFGAVRVFPERLRKAYLRLGNAIVDRDPDRMVTACHTLGFLGVDEPSDGMVRILETLLEPLLEDRAYDLAEFRSADRAMDVASVAIENRLLRAPGHRLFLLRALAGLEANVRRLGAVANWRRILAEELESADGA